MSISSGNSLLKRTEATNLYTDAVDCFPDNVPVSGLCDSRSVFVRTISPVVSLRDHINPLHIIRGVRAVIVSAVYGKSGLPLVDVVRVESSERGQPSCANRNPTPTVVLERFVFRVCASAYHCAMHCIKGVFGAARNVFVFNSILVALSSLFVFPTAAGNNLPVADVLTSDSLVCSAVTDAIPHGSAISFCFPIRAQSNEPAKPLSSYVNSEFLGSSGRHDVSNLGNGMSGLYHGADAPEYKFWMNPDDVYDGSQAIQFSGRLYIAD